MQEVSVLAPGTLSVIPTNCNNARYLGEALRAILNQSLRPKEVIVVDDGSTDNSIAVIKEFEHTDSIVHLVCNDRNQGVLFSGNGGPTVASGDYVCWAVADDKVLPGFSEKSEAPGDRLRFYCRDRIWQSREQCRRLQPPQTRPRQLSYAFGLRGGDRAFAQRYPASRQHDFDD